MPQFLINPPVRSGQVTVRAIRYDGKPGRSYVVEADARPWGWEGRSRMEQLVGWDTRAPSLLRRVDLVDLATIHGECKEKAIAAAGDYPHAFRMQIGAQRAKNWWRYVYFVGPNAKRIYDAFFWEDV